MKKDTIGSLILLMTTVIYLALVMIQNAPLFAKPFDFAKTKKAYEESQWQQSQNFSESVVLEKWAVQKGYTGWNNYVDENKNRENTDRTKERIIGDLRKKGISDAQLYAYAGYEYLHGKDPTLLNPEHPPLGKYLIGLSITLFGNEHVILVIAGALSLVFLFWLTLRMSGSRAAAALAVFLTATHTLFVDQLINGPQLDLFQLLFLIPVFIALHFHRKTGSPAYLIAGGISLGLLVSVKTFFVYFLVFNIWICAAIFLGKGKTLRKLRDFAVLNAAALLTFTLTYLPFFLQGGSLRKFLGVQKYIVTFYRQSGISPIPYIGNYLRLIFTGSWKFWDAANSVTAYEQWTIMWMFLFIAGILVTIRFLKKGIAQHNHDIMSAVAFTGIYNTFLFFFPVFPRYLLILFVMYHSLIASYFMGKNKR